MNDFAAIARILGAIRACEGRPFDVSMIRPEILGIDEARRDSLAIKLQHARKVEGLVTTEGIDNAPVQIIWKSSRPEITLEGLEYIVECSPLRKAMNGIASTVATTAISAITSSIQSML